MYCAEVKFDDGSCLNLGSSYLNDLVLDWISDLILAYEYKGSRCFSSLYIELLEDIKNET